MLGAVPVSVTRVRLKREQTLDSDARRYQSVRYRWLAFHQHARCSVRGVVECEPDFV